jgi:biuret amidohydrolase
MSWKTDNRSLYYLGAPEPDSPVINAKETALLVIDVQNTYLERPNRETLSAAEQVRFDLWTPFHNRMHNQVIPNTEKMLNFARRNGIECIFAEDAGLEQLALAEK